MSAKPNHNRAARCLFGLALSMFAIASGCSVPTPVAPRLLAPELFRAIERRDADRVTELIGAGADVNEQDSIGNTPLHHAVGQNSPAFVLSLLRAGANIDAKNQLGLPPLNYAVGSRNVSMVELLVSHGASLGSGLDKDFAPILVATENQDTEMLRVLVACGADVNHGANEWRTPLMRASGLDAVETIGFLIANGADINASDGEGSTALLTASLSGSSQAFDKLLTAGADVLHRDNKGQSALSFAAFNGDPNMVKKLLDRNASINDLSVDGRNPLHMAALARQDDAILLLAGAGATPVQVDLNVEDIEATAYAHARLAGLYRTQGRATKARSHFAVAAEWYAKAADVYQEIAGQHTRSIWGTYFSNALSYALASQIARHKAKSNTVVTPSGDVVGVGTATYKLEATGDYRQSRQHFRELEGTSRKLAEAYEKESRT